MLKDVKALSIVPMGSWAEEEPPTFREVIAYLKGVADAVTANDRRSPVAPSVACVSPRESRPCSDVFMEQPSGTAPVCRESGDALTGTSDADRVTLRYGEMELAFERSTVRPRLALAASYHPTRGGARLLDLDPTGCTLSSVPALPARRYTLPYEVPAASVVPFGDYVLSVRPQRSSNPVSSSWYPEVGDRASGVQLRNAKLASEWYELTGTQA